MEKQIGEHESKYVFANAHARKVIFWLQDRCIQDPDYPVGKVSSIYFDTPDWLLLAEKLNSDYLKTKIRLRWYSDLVTGVPLPKNFLEAKFKTGSARRKIRVETNLDTRWIAETSLTDTAFLQIPQLLRSHGVMCPRPLHPGFQINYSRFRFIDPLTGARLCVDHDIHVARCNPRLLHSLRIHPLKQAVFEFKERSGILSDWLHQITAFGGHKEAFSKYSACYQQVASIHF